MRVVLLENDMQINRINNSQSFKMGLAKDFYKIWHKPNGVWGESSAIILKRLDESTPQHFITRVHSFFEPAWIAVPKPGSKAQKIKVTEGFFSPSQYDSLVEFDEKLSKEYSRLAKLDKKA